MNAVVEADQKGRILLPVEIRRKLRSNRFKITQKGDHLELQPLTDVEDLKGKYRHLIRSEWEELEEKAEGMVSDGKR